MSLYFTITLSLLIFLTGSVLYFLVSYLSYQLSRSKNLDGLQHKLTRKQRRKGKYILNHFTARIFFGEVERKHRIKVVNGSTPLTTEKYSFTQTKRFDN